ncbi:MAG: hypothetical protein ACK5MN_03335 [Lachnospiraceae bacterium]
MTEVIMRIKKLFGICYGDKCFKRAVIDATITAKDKDGNTVKEFDRCFCEYHAGKIAYKFMSIK